MKKNKIIHVLLIEAIFFTLIAPKFAGIKNLEIQTHSNICSNNFNNPISAGNHTTISINGNAELATFVSNEGFSGNGTYAIPYIIEDLTIDCSYAHGISIRNTDAYLLIQNCTVEGHNRDYYGIYLNNTSNVEINNNTLAGNLNGIILHHSTNNILSRNNAKNNISFR